MSTADGLAPARRVRAPGVLRRSLRARLVAYFALLAVVTVALLSLVVNARATDQLGAAAADRLDAAAALKVDAIEAWLDDQRNSVIFTAGLLSAGTDGSDPARTLLGGDANAADAADAAGTIREILVNVVEQSANADELVVLDAAGTVVVSSTPGHEGGTQADAPFFERASTSTRVEGVYESSLTGQPTIAVATPIFDSTGERLGVLASFLDLVRLDRITRERTGLGATGEAFLVGADGRLVSSAIGAAAGDEVSSSGVEAALGGSDGRSRYETESGTPVIGAWRWLRELDAVLMAEMTEQEAFAPARELAGTIALVGLAAVALLALGIAFVSRAVTRPIQDLAAVATDVAHGNLDAAAQVTSEDEVGALERAFNAMTAQLRENVATLEHRVEERTAELRQRNTELAIVNEVGQALAKQLDFTAILEAVGERAAEALSAKGLSIAMKDPETGIVTFHYWIDQGKRSREFEGTILNDPLTARILDMSTPIRIGTAGEAEAMGAPFKVGGTESYLGVPIPAGDRSIGVIAIGTHEPNAYSDDDERLLTTLATNMGVALDNARLFGELNAALQAKGEAEVRYRRLVEELPLSLYIDHPDERATSIYVNPTIETMFGYPSERWFDDGFFESIIHPDDREQVLANHMDVFARGDERWTWEYRLLHADGRTVWVHDEAVIVRDEAGAAQYVQGFLIDVTEEREASARLEAANAALGAAEARYRQLVEELPLVLYIDRADATATSTYISPQVVRLAGYPIERWLEDGFFESILHPDDRDRVMQEQTAMFRDADIEDRFSTDYRLTAADGHTVWIRDDGRLISNEDGSASHVQGFMLDITEEKEAAHEVRRQKTYFEALVEASPVAIVVMNRDEIVTAWNPAAERLFGYAATEAVGSHIDDLIFSEERRAEGQITTTEAREKGRSQRIDQRMRKDGRMVDVEIVVVPLMLDGEHVGYYAIYHDISELEEARKAAEAANHAKGAFLAAMSHEIRTPMNAIIGMSGLLVDTPLADDQREYAETIRVSSEALLTIINDILDFSKIEAGRVELEAEPFSPQRVIEGALDVLAPAAAAKGIELAYEPGADVPPALVGDAGRLRQVLLNLLSNAVKFTESGEVVLSVDGTTVPDGRWEGRIEVRDTGIGIPPERMDGLFQSFSQLDASVSRRYGGTGLGLAISRRLAELMEGTLTAESTGVAGAGSTFRLCFRAPISTEALAESPAAPAGEVAGKTVLVVDDNATNRRILELQADRWSMKVRATGSPKEALAWVKEGAEFDAALLDLNMPEMSGVELAGKLRRLRPKRPLPVIILSSIGPAEATEKSIRTTLTKPLKPSALHDALADLFGTSGRVAPAVAASGPQDGDEEAARLADAHPLRILLAEDNAMNRRLALLLLERMGYSADVAENGQEVLDAVTRAPYDVIFMDVQMPEMDGLEATRRIRATHPDDARPRIIALTANALAEDREATVQAGMDDYVSKPIRPAELEGALRRTEARTDA